MESFNLEDGSGCEFDDSSDIQVGNAFLAPLAYNGGQTQTHGLLPESRAIGGAHQLACTSFIDQRGYPRPDGPCEIGAFEVVEFSPAEPGDGSGGPANCTDSFAQCTLREAVDQASAYDTVFVNAGVWALDGSLILNGDDLVGASPRSTLDRECRRRGAGRHGDRRRQPRLARDHHWTATPTGTSVAVCSCRVPAPASSSAMPR